MESEFIQWINLNLPGYELTPNQIDLLLHIKMHFETIGTQEMTSQLFNRVHNKKKQKVYGITYTPKEICIELTHTILENLKQYKCLDTIKVCDPCCGSGLFSLTLIELLLKNNISIQNAVKKNVYFSDIDPISVATALTNLYVFASKKGINPIELKPNCSVIDFFDVEEKFDAFITNPPYVKLQNLSSELRENLKNRYPDLFVGSMGMSSFFLKKMLDDLNVDGSLGIITQNNFFTSNSGKKLREAIQSNIFKIDNFGSELIFENVTAYSCLLYASQRKTKFLEYRKLNKFEGFKKDFSIINTDALDPTKWRLGTSEELRALSILEKKGKQLGKACRIWVGIATQFDKAFTVNFEKKMWIGTTPTGDKVPIETEIVKPLLKVSEFVDEISMRSNSRGVIYPYQIIDGKAIAFGVDEMLMKYPKTMAFLNSWKEDLIARDKGAIAPEKWYLWGRTQSMIPVKNKLLTKTFNHGPKFFFDNTESLFSNGYAITITDSSYDLDFVKAVLNSKMFFYYAKLTSFEIDGEYQCYQKNFIERFCLPLIDISTQKAILAENRIDRFLEEYYEISLP